MDLSCCAPKVLLEASALRTATESDCAEDAVAADRFVVSWPEGSGRLEELSSSLLGIASELLLDAAGIWSANSMRKRMVHKKR